MSKTAKRLTILGAISVLLFTATACSSLQKNLDVVGKGSVASFEAVLNAVPDQVEADGMNVGWSLSAPDGTARFVWGEDWSSSPQHDIMLEFDATPFMEAGLDPEKLPGNYAYYEGTLMVGTKLGDNAPQYGGNPTPFAAYEQIVNLSRDSIGYHMELDHYGVDLGGGNLFEWAKDMNTNDKDIVFALNPEPLIAAGVDPEAVDGWVFAKVKAHVDGRPAEVDKLLKPFNLI